VSNLVPVLVMEKLVAVIIERMIALSAHVASHDATLIFISIAKSAVLVANRALSVAHPADGIVSARLYLF